jgi:hypothetical protein
MIASGFIRKPKLMVKASIEIQVKDCWSGDTGLAWNICVKIKQLQTKEVKMPAMAMRELKVLEFKKKSVIRTHAASGAKKAIQTK